MINYNRMDEDGHIYQIPDDLLEDFDSLERRVMEAPFMSEDEEVAISDFHYHFSQYRVG